MVLARHVTDKRYNPRRFAHLIRTMVLSLIPLLLVMAQPDLGTSIVFAAISLIAIIAAGTPFLYLLVLLSPIFAALAAINTYVMLGYFTLLVVVAWRLQLRLLLMILLVLGNLSISLAAPQIWNQLKPYQKNRLVSFFNPEVDPQGSGYQVIQSKVAIGSGGFGGKGLGEGSQTQLKFLPEQHTDFIFSVVGEELGLVGATLVLAFLLLVISRGYRAALRSKGFYSALVCLGLSTMITVHAVINIGMAVGLMPVTGLPLPFLSYGGSFLWTIMIAIGLILGIQRRWKEYTP
jgi:rod shape determining protein RodA